MGNIIEYLKDAAPKKEENKKDYEKRLKDTSKKTKALISKDIKTLSTEDLQNIINKILDLIKKDNKHSTAYILYLLNHINKYQKGITTILNRTTKDFLKEYKKGLKRRF